MSSILLHRRDPERLATLMKCLPLRLGPPQGFERAISTSGGVAADGLVASSLMLKSIPVGPRSLVQFQPAILLPSSSFSHAQA